MMLICEYVCLSVYLFFFFNDTSTTEIYTLSLHDALPIRCSSMMVSTSAGCNRPYHTPSDRKSTRLNSSHTVISYAVFCLKKKKIRKHIIIRLQNTTRTQNST